MKQALSPEVPARVRRGQFRAITLGVVGISALAMACSFGEIDEEPGIGDPPDVSADTDNGSTDEVDNQGDTTVGNNDGDNDVDVDSDVEVGDDEEEAYNPDDPFASEQGQEVQDILRTYCGQCHIGPGSEGDMGYILDMDQLITGGKVVPGNKEDSQIFTRMQQQTMPPAYIRDNRPSYNQIDLVGNFIDELQLPDPQGSCEPEAFMDIDQQIEAMASDIASLDVEDQPFTRYLTITYSSNAGDCGRALQRQRYALFKGLNSVSTETTIHNPVAIDDAETIYRIDIREVDWDRDIDVEDDGVVDFADGWDAIINNEVAAPYAIQYTGDQADDLIADSGTNVPFLPVNVFIQATEFGDLYYTLIGGRQNLFVFEREVLNIDTAQEILDEKVMRGGFSDSGVSKQDRVLNRFDSGLAAGLSYWISFDFDGGNGGDGANGFERDVANESIYRDPLGFAFAGGEAIFNLPNGLQAYYVADAAGNRLALAPIGVVVDPAQNNGLVTNGASCHSCHNAGMITFTDTVRQYVEENPVDFDNETYEAVMAVYPTQQEFQAQMDKDSAIHIAAAEEAGVPPKTPDPISRVYLDFQLGDVTLDIAAGELAIEPEILRENINQLDPRLGNLAVEGGAVSRTLFTDTFFDSVCILQSVSNNAPANCQ